MKSAAGNQWRLATIGSVPQPRRHADGRKGWKAARREGVKHLTDLRFGSHSKWQRSAGSLTQRRAVVLAEPRLKHAQCFTGNGHRRSARPHTQMMMSVTSVVFWSWSIPQIGQAGRISQGVLGSLEAEDKRWTPGRVYDRPKTSPVQDQVHNRTPVLLEFLVRLPSVTSTGRWRERGIGRVR
jgi:hypothetical protein